MDGEKVPSEAVEGFLDGIVLGAGDDKTDRLSPSFPLPSGISTDRSRESLRGSGWGHCLECSSASWSELKMTEPQVCVSRLFFEVRP